MFFPFCFSFMGVFLDVIVAMGGSHCDVDRKALRAANFVTFLSNQSIPALFLDGGGFVPAIVKSHPGIR
jgi:hypothetical protein